MSRKKHVDLWLLHYPVETKVQKEKKSVAVVDYNQGKSGNDLSDQYTAVATSLRKGIKWYRKLAFEMLLRIALVNSYLDQCRQEKLACVSSRKSSLKKC